MHTQEEIENARNLLGVDKKASTDDIKKAYRRQAIKDHPDKNVSDTTEKFQALNNAHELLQKTNNGQNQVLKTVGSPVYADLYQFYAFFDSNQTSSLDDKISESAFQNILNEVEANINKHAGLVYARYESLKGISAEQIKRFINHAEDYNGTRFRLSGQMFRPEVLVALLTCLTDYRLASNERCELDISDIDIKHPEVIATLSSFTLNAKSKWRLILNKTHLAMDDELAMSLASSQQIYELSLKNNRLNDNHILSIFKGNQTIEAIDLEESYFSEDTLIDFAQTTVTHANFSSVSLSIFNRGSDEQAGNVLNAFFQNQNGLKRIALHGSPHAKPFLKKHDLVVNPRIESLTLRGFDINGPTITLILSHALPNLKTLHIDR